MKLFLSDVALRESCYNCNFKLGNKYSDITLGDFWGVKNCYPDMYNKEGVSAVIINTLKGKDAFNAISDNLVFKDCNIGDILNGNPSLKISSVKPRCSNNFWQDIDKYNMNNLCKKYCKKQSLFVRGKNKIKRIILHILGK